MVKIINKTLHNIYGKTLIIEHAGDYKFFELGADLGKHYRVWINRVGIEKVKRGHALNPLIKNTEVFQGKKERNLILSPSENSHVIIAKIPGGFRGGAKILSIEPKPIKMFEFDDWQSRRGRLGRGVGVLLEVKENTQVVGEYYGRTEGFITLKFNVDEEIVEINK